MKTTIATLDSSLCNLDMAITQATALIHLLADRCAELESIHEPKPKQAIIGAGLCALDIRTTDDLVEAFDVVETSARNPGRS